MGYGRFNFNFILLMSFAMLLISCADSTTITETESAYHIPKNTQLTLTLQVALSSNTNQRGDTFKATLNKPVKLGESVILPTNSVINGLVKNATTYKKFGDKASLVLIFDQILLSSGIELPILASLDTRPGSVPIRIGGKEPKQTKMILNTAVMGALMENPSDMQRIGEGGLLLGAMMGTSAVLLSNAKSVLLPKGTEVTISLDESLIIPKS